MSKHRNIVKEVDSNYELKVGELELMRPISEILYEAEEYECAMMVLDDMDIPREKFEETLSLVGRIQSADDELVEWYCILLKEAIDYQKEDDSMRKWIIKKSQKVIEPYLPTEDELNEHYRKILGDRDQ